MVWRGSPRACFLNAGSEMRVAMSAGRVVIAVHYGKGRHKLCSLGVYLAYSTSDVSFERSTLVVILDTPGMI